MTGSEIRSIYVRNIKNVMFYFYKVILSAHKYLSLFNPRGHMYSIQ